MSRNKKIDIFRGILILMVVWGHSGLNSMHDIIFLFHMPLFFILSGFLVEKDRLLKREYLKNKLMIFVIPYLMYTIIDFGIFRRDLSLLTLCRVLYGGRAISGVYWYITCYLFALFLLSASLRKFSDKMSKALILMGGGTAVIESNLIDKIHLLQSPGIPWNLDVSLMALVYVGIGFFYKDKIKELLESELRKYDLVAAIISASLILFCWLIYKYGNRLYYFDMKPVYYKELISAILIPCTFGIVLIRLVHWIEKTKCLEVLNRFLILCGRVTIPIMFIHIPLNHWKETFRYGRGMYVAIGVGIPLAFTLFFNKYKFMRKLFRLPKL